MEVKYPQVGVCGLSCRFCPRYHTDGLSRCYGCKTESRMAAGCPFITCAVKKKGIEFCWGCEESADCQKWLTHREHGKQRDSFVSYQGLEDNIRTAGVSGVESFVKSQIAKEKLLNRMLSEFNEGRSKSYYCIAATVMTKEDLEEALATAAKISKNMDIKDKAKTLHTALDEIAERNNYVLHLRKPS